MAVKNPEELAQMTTKIILTSFSYYRLKNSKVLYKIYAIKHIVNASECTIDLWLHSGGLLSSQELESSLSVISVHNGNMKHARAIEFY